MAADMVDYSRLMGEDQARTLGALRLFRETQFEPAVKEHGGNVVKGMGDGWIVEFPSIMDAVACAIMVQENLTDHEIIKIRIGIHIGDVVFEAEDVFGDGVNIAARLEALADPGQILISENAYHSLDSKNGQSFIGGGPQQLKNIARPVHVWRWQGTGLRDTAAVIAGPTPTGNRPAIAVLAFDNMSGDPEQEFFSDGIAGDIITELSRFSWLKIIAQNSSFLYKGKAVDLRQVGQELGVRYILEGSVRRASDRVRVTAQLIDTRMGDNIWADRYDRDLDDIFAVQDEITRAITRSIAPNLEFAEMDLARQREPANLDSWELTHRAHSEYYRLDKNNTVRANELHRQAVERDPKAALARAYLALGLTASVILRQTVTPDEALIEAETQARTALEIDRKNTVALWALGQVALLSGENEKACRYIERAVAVNPNDARIQAALGQSNIMCGRYEAGIEAILKGIEISPRDPHLATEYSNMAFANFQSGRLDMACEWAEKALEEAPDYGPGLRYAAAIHASLGNIELARRHINKLKTLDPKITISTIAEMPMYSAAVDLVRLLEALRNAGLPE